MTPYTGPIPGDIGFARTKLSRNGLSIAGVMGWLIRLGEWLRFRRCKVNHQFVVERVVDGVPYVIQATMRGVTDTARLDEVAPGGEVITMAPPKCVDREKLLEFCRSKVGLEYGYLTDLAIAIDTVTWQWVPAFRGARKESWQCAALINQGMLYAGWLHDWLDIYTIFPEQGYDALLAALANGE